MGKTLMIADDSLFMRTYLKSLLVGDKYKVISEASNGEEAINNYKKYQPDIVLLDITMPDVNGLHALKEIKKINPSAIIIICSALGQKSIIVDALQYGAKDFIIKPYFGNLVQTLENTI